MSEIERGLHGYCLKCEARIEAAENMDAVWVCSACIDVRPNETVTVGRKTDKEHKTLVLTELKALEKRVDQLERDNHHTKFCKQLAVLADVAKEANKRYDEQLDAFYAEMAGRYWSDETPTE